MGQKDSVRARAVELGRLSDRYEALCRAARAPEMRRFLAGGAPPFHPRLRFEHPLPKLEFVGLRL